MKLEESRGRRQARASESAGSMIQNFLGGSPLSVLVKLIFLSLLVGAFLAFLDVTPFELVNRVMGAFRSIFGLSFDAVRDIGRWVLYGAIIVVPVWLLVRVFNAAR
jgi:hypothetical protein